MKHYVLSCVFPGKLFWHLSKRLLHRSAGAIMSWSIGLGGALSLQLHEEWVVQQKCHPMYQTNVLCESMTKKKYGGGEVGKPIAGARQNLAGDDGAPALSVCAARHRARLVGVRATVLVAPPEHLARRRAALRQRGGRPQLAIACSGAHRSLSPGRA